MRRSATLRKVPLMATTPDPAAVEAYLAGLPAAERAAVATVRDEVLTVLPDAEQRISYGIITLRSAGRDIVGVGKQGSHLGFYAMSATLLGQITDQLDGWPVSGKGTLRFSVEQPIPAAVVRTVVVAKVERQG